MKLLWVFQIYIMMHLACSELLEKEIQRKNKSLQPGIANKKSLLIKDVESVPPLQNRQKDKDKFVAEETYNYYPSDYPYQRGPRYGPVAFPNYSPHDDYYPIYKPHIYARDSYFWNRYNDYDRRRFNNF